MNKRRIAALLLVMATVLALASCNLPSQGAGLPQADAGNSAAAPSEAAAVPSPSESSAVPVIAGSNVTEITQKLEEVGFPKVELPATVGATNEYVNDKADTQTGINFSCDIYYIPGGNAIASASFTAQSTTESNADFLGGAETFLAACTALSYDGADAAAVKTWIHDNIGAASKAGASTTVGDAMFTLYGNVSDKGTPPTVWIDISKAA